MMSFRDLSTMARHERQVIYADILREKRITMTPSIVKAELEKRSMTFAFVGQDMAAMRLMPFIQIEERGRYRWNESFEGEVTLTATRRSCAKRSRVEMERRQTQTPPPLVLQQQQQRHEFKRHHVSRKVTDSDMVDGGARVSDEGLNRALDALLAVAERESESPCERWVMGYRICE